MSQVNNFAGSPGQCMQLTCSCTFSRQFQGINSSSFRRKILSLFISMFCLFLHFHWIPYHFALRRVNTSDEHEATRSSSVNSPDVISYQSMKAQSNLLRTVVENFCCGCCRLSPFILTTIALGASGFK